ncbi:cytochrome P450 [Actinoalloteichus spitiensis]|uniref:cytochrome P450 n=1 Tax=Actinoalloteichus spitiensis TaxID=252394 RepID=UPI00037CCDCE|nr:cytochrome P450 [Actinoalloteichus spitiensis]
MDRETDRPRTVPTAPGGLPLVGHLPALVRGRVSFLQRLRGHGEVVRIHLGRRPIYVVNSPELLHRMFTVRADSFGKGRFFENMRPYMGNGVATSEGGFHHRQRRLMAPAFHRVRLESHVALMRREAERMTSRWRPDHPIRLDHQLHHLTTVVVARALFSTSLSDRTATRIVLATDAFVRGVAWRLLAPDALERLPTPANRRFLAERDLLREIIRDLVADRMRTPGHGGDLMAALLSAREEGTGRGMTAEQLHDEVLTLLLAGSETAAGTMGWLFHELGRHPAVEHRLRAELDEVLAGRPVTAADLPRLVYTRRVVEETLRRHHVNWLLTRRTLHGVRLGRYWLPADAEVLYSLTAQHRDPTLFPDPLRFDPDRWDTAPPKHAFTPFAAGPHKCLGAHFVMTEMVVVVATVVAAWRLRPTPDPVRPVATMVLRPNALPMLPERVTSA